ncbi:beta-lactamase-like protein [Melampsora americana]|nr:beta-lactamase-like protein [Melampsora americana]
MASGIGNPIRTFGIKTEIHIRPITVCSTDTTSASLLLTFPQARYLFNCPENTSRSFVQSRIPCKYLSAIFLATPRVEHSAGLHGFLLGLADIQREKLIRIIGPLGTRYMMACGRLYTRREGMAVEAIEFVNRNQFEQVFKDDLITVYALGSESIASKRALEPPNTSSQANKRQKVIGSAHINPESVCAETSDVPIERTGCTPRNPSAWLDSVLQDMFRPPTTDSQKPKPDTKSGPTPAYSYDKLEAPEASICSEPSSYFVVGPKYRGKFLPQKAKEFGVKPGPDFAKLANGEDLVLPDGRVIQGKMCLEGGSDGSAFYISNVANKDHLNSTTLPELQEMQELAQGAKLTAIFHFVGGDVLLDERYVAWLTGFSSHTKHYLSSPSHSPDLFSFEPSVLLQLKLSLVSPTLFPIPYRNSNPKKPPVHLPNLSDLDRFQVIPINGEFSPGPELVRLNYDLIDNPKPTSELIKTLELEEGFPDILARIRRIEMENSDPKPDTIAGRIMVTTLGTGSAIPSKYRNVSGTLLHIPAEADESHSGFHYALLDSGEGTLGQIKRNFGSRWEEVLRDLRLIFISHLHADHHSGLATLLIARHKLSAVSPLVLVSQYGVNLYLREKSLIEPMGIEQGSVHWIDVEKLVGARVSNQDQNFKYAELLPKGMELETVRVIHWGKCFGLCLRNRIQGWKIVFSGDTKRCPELIQAGIDADLLIHEASLGVDQKDLADFKGHCTIDQAIDVGLESVNRFSLSFL